MNLQYTSPAFKANNVEQINIRGHNPYKRSLSGRKQKKLVPKNVNVSAEASAVLKQWLHANQSNPYPTEPEKLRLAQMTNLTLLQVLSRTFL